jgi:hypothetical protein
MLTKASTAALWPVICLAILARVWLLPARNEGLASRLLRSFAPAALAGVIALLVAAPWLARNTRLYGDPLGWPLVLATIDQRTASLAAADYGWLARGWFLSFWGKFGGAGHIALPAVFYWIWGALLLATIAGWLAFVLQKRRTPASRIAPEGWVMMVGAPIAAAAAILSYSRTALGTDQGRLLFPALGVIGLWVAGGMSAWLPGRRLPALLGSGMALIALLALIVGIVWPYAPPPEPLIEEVMAAKPIEQQFGADLELLSAKWTEQTAPELVLYWRALHPVDDDLRTAVRLVDAEGNLVWEWKRSPGAGRMSTDRWPAGRVFEDVYRVPTEALADAQRLEVGVRPFPEGPWLPVDGEDVLTLSTDP